MKNILKIVLLSSLVICLNLPTVFAIDTSLVISEKISETQNSKVCIGKYVKKSGILKLMDEQIILVEKNGSESYLKFNKSSKILDSVTLMPIQLNALCEGESVELYVSPIQTMIYPSELNVSLLFANIPMDMGFPQFYIVSSVEATSEGFKLNTDCGEVLTLNYDTPINPYRTRNIVTLTDIKSGSEILVRTSNVMGKIGVSDVILFPYSYDGSIIIESNSLILKNSINETFLPTTNKIYNSLNYIGIREVAEFLDYNVSWNSNDNSIILEKNGNTKLLNVIQKKSYNSLSLEFPVILENGISYIHINDLINLFNLFN